MKTKKLILSILCASIAGVTGVSAEATAHADAKTSTNGTSSSETYIETTVTKNGVTTRKVEHKKNGVDVTENEGEPGAEAAPWLGLRVTEASSALRDQLGLGDKEGVVVDLVAPDGPADKAGLRVNDILLKFEDQPLGTPQDLQASLDKCQIGQTVTIDYLRRGEKSEATVTLEKRPDKHAGVGNDPNGGEAFEKMQERLREFREKQRVQGEGGNSFKIEVVGDELGDLEEILKNPNVPEDFKKAVQDMQDRMRDFKEKHDGR